MNSDRASDEERWDGETVRFRARLMDLVETSPNYSGSQINYGTRELSVFGVGSPSPAVSALISEAPSILQVTWREAPYTRVELTDEARRLMRTHPERLYSGGGLSD